MDGSWFWVLKLPNLVWCEVMGFYVVCCCVVWFDVVWCDVVLWSPDPLVLIFVRAAPGPMREKIRPGSGQWWLASGDWAGRPPPVSQSVSETPPSWAELWRDFWRELVRSTRLSSTFSSSPASTDRCTRGGRSLPRTNWTVAPVRQYFPSLSCQDTSNTRQRTLAGKTNIQRNPWDHQQYPAPQIFSPVRSQVCSPVPSAM